MQARIAVERQLEVAQQITHIGSWEWDLSTNGVAWSDELYRIYGLEPRSCEITLDGFLARVHPDDRAMIQAAIGKALESGDRFAWVERIVRTDGSIRTVDTVGEVVKDKSGRATGLIGTCRDVTEERKRDEQIRRYADIVHNVQIGLTVWSVGNPDDPATFRLMAFNPAAERLARRALADCVGKAFPEILPYAEGGQLQSLIALVARDGAVREANVLGSRNPDDPTRAVSIKAFPLPGAGVGIALEDITAPTRTRKLQAAEQGVLEMIAEGAPLASILSRLVQAVEEHSPPTIGAIHLREAEELRCPNPVAPSLAQPATALVVYAAAPILAKDERDLGDFVLYVRVPQPQAEDDAVVLERAAHVARIAIERCQLEDQLRELSAHVESIREDERTGIAREIHDELGQSLTALKMDIAWIVRRSASESISVTKEALLEKLAAMSKMTDEIIHQVRRISAELRPGVLDDLGLVAAIEWQGQEFEARTGTTCVVHADLALPALDRHTSTAVFRIFQEALTNVTRHAEAKHVEVRLEIQGPCLHLHVSDDGKGITPDATRSPRSLGLLGIRERARRLGGSVEITGAPGRGTTVSLRVPIGARAEEER